MHVITAPTARGFDVRFASHMHFKCHVVIARKQISVLEGFDISSHNEQIAMAIYFWESSPQTGYEAVAFRFLNVTVIKLFLW